jgi:hypothetical protein
MLAAPIMGHDVIFTLFDVAFWRIFFTVIQWGREGFLLDKYHVELLLIGCTAWFDNKSDISPHGWQN